MDESRKKAKNALKIVFNKEQNINTIEKNIYDVSMNNLKKYENLEDVYLFNIYQLINDILNNDNNINHQELLKNIKKGNIYWRHEFLNEFIKKEIEQENFLIKPFEIEEGVLQCKCGSKKVFSYQKQVRSLDEPASTFATCTSCGSKWVYSG